MADTWRVKRCINLNCKHEMSLQKFSTHAKIKYTELWLHRPSVCEKIHPYLPSNKKMHITKKWFLFCLTVYYLGSWVIYTVVPFRHTGVAAPPCINYTALPSLSTACNSVGCLCEQDDRLICRINSKSADDFRGIFRP